jgi:hypothetical protein
MYIVICGNERYDDSTSAQRQLRLSPAYNNKEIARIRVKPFRPQVQLHLISDAFKYLTLQAHFSVK